MNMHPLDHRRRRLLYRATHRGTYENDLMIGGFATVHIQNLDGVELDALEAVMAFPDAELADWLTGRKPLPAEADTAMMRRVKDAAAAMAQRAAQRHLDNA